VYIPFGGSRGSVAMVYRNLMLTMLIGGLWHGASWVFVVWGAYHGVLLCLNRAFASQWLKIWYPIRVAATFLLMVVGWVFFRSKDFTMAAYLLERMFSYAPSAPVTAMATLCGLLAIGFGFGHWGKNTFEMKHEWGFAMRCVWLGVLAACLLRIVTWPKTPFLYFQF
jgi:alginate O-acetyltransferase complex protein AlgI